MTKVNQRWGMLGLVGALLCAEVGRAGEVPTLDQVVTTYVAIVERIEYDRKDRRGVKKWFDEVSYRITGHRPHWIDDEISEHLRWVAVTTGLLIRRYDGSHDEFADLSSAKVTFRVNRRANRFSLSLSHVGLAEDPSGPNLMIIFASQPELALGADKLDASMVVRSQIDRDLMPCLSTVFLDGDAPMIRAAVVIIRYDVDARIRRRCLVEELTQIFGLTNDVRKSRITLFDDVLPPRRTELTTYDKMFLQVLYDTRMTLGLTGSALKTRAQDLLGAALQRPTR